MAYIGYNGRRGAAMNRAIRHRRRPKAAELAREYLASGIVIAGLCGGVARLEHPTARRIVREEIFRMMRDNGRPRLRHLDHDEAQCMRFMRTPIDGVAAWLAVGLDVDGRATLLARWLSTALVGDGEAACGLRIALRAALEVERGRSGLPMPVDVEGRARLEGGGPISGWVSVETRPPLSGRFLTAWVE